MSLAEFCTTAATATASSYSLTLETAASPAIITWCDTRPILARSSCPSTIGSAAGSGCGVSSSGSSSTSPVCASVTPRSAAARWCRFATRIRSENSFVEMKPSPSASSSSITCCISALDRFTPNDPIAALNSFRSNAPELSVSKR